VFTGPFPESSLTGANRYQVITEGHAFEARRGGRSRNPLQEEA
jgi:hypothetical protein